jgi:hypothetical protein
MAPANSRPIRSFALAHSGTAFWALGLTAGVAASWRHWHSPDSAFHAWMRASAGWEMSAFAAFTAMSGFGLASLALVASLSTHERGREVIESNPGRAMLRRVVASTWWWMVPGVIALAHVFWPDLLVECCFVATVPITITRAAEALLAVTIFFRRFTVRLPT